MLTFFLICVTLQVEGKRWPRAIWGRGRPLFITVKGREGKESIAFVPQEGILLLNGELLESKHEAVAVFFSPAISSLLGMSEVLNKSSAEGCLSGSVG